MTPRVKNPVRDRAKKILRDSQADGSKGVPPEEAVEQAREEIKEEFEDSHSSSRAKSSSPSWSLKMTPEEYLERYPDGPNAAEAREALKNAPAKSEEKTGKKEADEEEEEEEKEKEEAKKKKEKEALEGLGE